jgi:pimeloyl-ACP methyl ester carboxylesterase
MKTPPIILVPGFWLGAWAWDEVARLLRADGHDVTALTLPGLEAKDADRSSITAEDHVRAIVDAITSKDEPVVLAVHSGAGFPGYAATDRVPDRIAHMVYVDTGAGVGAMDEEFDGAEMPLHSPEKLAAEENLTGLSEEQLATFQERAVPEPGGVLRTGVELTNDARRDVPTTVIATAFPSDEYKQGVKEGWGFLRGFQEVRNVTWVDLPTSHWPMWSRPKDLAAIIGRIASDAASDSAAPAGAVRAEAR